MAFMFLPTNACLASNDYYVHDPTGSVRHCTRDGDDIYCDDTTTSGGASLDQMRRAGYVTEGEADQRNAASLEAVLGQAVQRIQKRSQDKLNDIQSDAKIDPSYNFAASKIFISDDGNLDARIAYSHLIPLLRQKGYQFVLSKSEADLSAWAGIKNQADKGYMTLNLYFFRTSNDESVIDAFAAKKIDRVHQSELIKALCEAIAQELPNVN